jgi:hypothetical protein
MARFTTLVTILVLVGCVDIPCPPSHSESTTSPETRILILGPDGEMKEVVRELDVSLLVGDYWEDRVYIKHYLSLENGGKFEKKSEGCKGTSGPWCGEWSVERAGVKLVYERAKDFPPDILLILWRDGEYFLLPEVQRERYLAEGLESCTCYKRTGPQK